MSVSKQVRVIETSPGIGNVPHTNSPNCCWSCARPICYSIAVQFWDSCPSCDIECVHVMRICDFSVLVSGQVLTSRTETIEEFLKPRVRRLAVVGLAGVFQRAAEARLTEYADGRRVSETRLPRIFVSAKSPFLRSVQLTVAFGVYLLNVLSVLLRVRGKFDMFIGVSCFSALGGVLLKGLGKVRRLVYYSIDYYPRPPRAGFESFMVWAFRRADAFIVRKSDVVWHISPRIADVRNESTGIQVGEYRHITVPLCYRDDLPAFRPVSEVERSRIGFVGTLTMTQGLQLLIDALPDIVKAIPLVKVHIIGQGPDGDRLRSMVTERCLQERVVFEGFVPDENRMLEMVSRFGVGLATWTDDAYNNIRFADPGKPKLYLALGVPCVITCGSDIADAIAAAGAGRSIAYCKDELVRAIVDVIGDEGRWSAMRKSAFELGSGFTSSRILGPAMIQTLETVGGAETPKG